MVLDKQRKELMGSAHLGLHEVSLSLLLRRETPLLDDEAIFWPSQGPAGEEACFLQQPILSMWHLCLQSFILSYLTYSTFELLPTRKVPSWNLSSKSHW